MSSRRFCSTHLWSLHGFTALLVLNTQHTVLSITQMLPWAQS